MLHKSGLADSLDDKVKVKEVKGEVDEVKKVNHINTLADDPAELVALDGELRDCRRWVAASVGLVVGVVVAVLLHRLNDAAVLVDLTQGLIVLWQIADVGPQPDACACQLLHAV